VTAIITPDEVAKELFGKNLLLDIPLPDRGLIKGAVDRSNAAISSLLAGNIGYSQRAEYLATPPKNNRTGPLAVMAYESVRTRLPLIHGPVGVASIQVYEHRDRRLMPSAYGADELMAYGEDYDLEFERIEVVGEVDLAPSVTIRRMGVGFPKPPGAIFVRYMAGITEENSPDKWALIRTATLQTFQAQFYAAKQTASVGSNAGPIASESLGSYSYSLNTQAAAMTSSGVAQSAMATLADVIDYGVYL
jgi:hypothetical protein